MKKLFISFALCAFTFSAFSQDEKETRQPVQGDKAISLNFVGLATMALNSGVDPFNGSQVLDFRYWLADQWALRVGLGVATTSTTTRTENDTTGGVPLTETEAKNRNSAFSIGIGAERHIKTNAKTIDPYIGAGIYMSMIGKNKVDNMTKTTQANGDFNEMTSNTINPGGFGFGVGLNAGFFWYFAENIALGGEYGFGFGTGSTGGETEVKNKMVSSQGGTVTTTESTTRTTNKTNNSGLRTGSTGAINLLVKF